MVKSIWGGRKSGTSAASRKRKAGTTLTFTKEELAVLARLMAAGRVMLRLEHPVISKIKAAMTRVGVPAEPGLR